MSTELPAFVDDKWIYHSNGEIWGRCVLIPLPELTDDTVPTNPNNGKPYFAIPDKPFDAEWVAGEVTEIPSSAWGE